LDELVSIFKQFDNDGNAVMTPRNVALESTVLTLGFVSVDDFKEKCKKLYEDKGFTSTDSTISKLAMLLDFNSDGIIDFNEFIEGSRLAREKCKRSPLQRHWRTPRDRGHIYLKSVCHFVDAPTM
uniref:EF-hand domain-containing protein n=1 Tax=Hydatigena taeniaeformis TaxID=6205 RepID=A0A0R3X0X9_HYDTA